MVLNSLCLFSLLLKAFYIKLAALYTPQQNGVVERKHQHILNIARALKFQSSIPLPCWGYYVQHTVLFINLTATPLLQNNNPCEMVHSRIWLPCLCLYYWSC